MALRLVAKGMGRMIEADRVSIPGKLVTAGAAVGGVIGLYEGSLWAQENLRFDDDMPVYASIAKPAVIGLALGTCTLSGALVGAVGVATTPLWAPYMTFAWAQRPREA